MPAEPSERGNMPNTAVKRGIWLVAALVALGICALLSLPYLASTQIVRDRIAQQLSAWSGYRVELKNAPEVDIWPVFGAVLQDVTFSQWQGRAKPVISADRVEIDLSAIAALRGDVVFSKVRLVRPTVRLAESGGVPLPSPPAGGRLLRSIDMARAASEDPASPPDPARMPSDDLGVIEFVDGRVIATGEGGPTDLVTSLSGRIAWPALNRAANITASGIWRGESVKLEAQLGQPLLLLAGRNSQTRVSLQSAPATIEFDGNANFAQDGFADGKFSLSTPSLRRMLEWSRADIATDAPIGSLTIGGIVSGGTERLKFADVRLTLDGNPGMGVLEVAYGNSVPGITGTLAFQTLDMQSLLAAFTSIAGSPGNGAQAIDVAIADRINLDLRLSADTARAGSIELRKVAATAQVKGGLTAFDISDATAFGGTLQAGFRLDRSPAGGAVEIRFVADDIETGAFAKTLGLERIVPQARGTISVILKGHGSTWANVFENSDGSISAQFGSGVISGVNLAALREKSGEVGFFPMSDITDGSVPIQNAELKASVSKGVARIDKAQARTSDAVVEFAGIVPYVGRGLALTGAVAPAKSDDSGRRSTFFVGGTWASPYIYAIQTPPVPGG